MKGANLLLDVLENFGVDTVFGYPGGAIMPIYDALVDSKIKHYLKLKSLRIWIWAVEAGRRKCETKSLELKVMQKSFQYMCKAAGHS